MDKEVVIHTHTHTHTHTCIHTETQASLGFQSVKNLPAMQETRIQSLGQEDPLEMVMATPSSILVWRSTWRDEPGEL